MTNVLIRRDLKTQGRHGEEGHAKMETECGVMLPQAKESQARLATTRG